MVRTICCRISEALLRNSRGSRSDVLSMLRNGGNLVGPEVRSCAAPEVRLARDHDAAF